MGVIFGESPRDRCEGWMALIELSSESSEENPTHCSIYSIDEISGSDRYRGCIQHTLLDLAELYLLSE